MSTQVVGIRLEEIGPAAEKANRELELLIQAKYPIVYLLTWEEERVTRHIRNIAQHLRIHNVRYWSLSKGFASLPDQNQVSETEITSQRALPS